MSQPDQEIISIVITGTLVLLLLVIFIIGFLFLYQGGITNTTWRRNI